MQKVRGCAEARSTERNPRVVGRRVNDRDAIYSQSSAHLAGFVVSESGSRNLYLRAS